MVVSVSNENMGTYGEYFVDAFQKLMVPQVQFILFNLAQVRSLVETPRLWVEIVDGGLRIAESFEQKLVSVVEGKFHNYIPWVLRNGVSFHLKIFNF